MTAIELGAKFHRQIAALLPADAHADDAAHDAAVGHALALFEQGDIVSAVTSYNGWALTHGYQPIERWGAEADGFWMAFATQRIVIDAAGDVLIVEPLAS